MTVREWMKLAGSTLMLVGVGIYSWPLAIALLGFMMWWDSN